eukprot:6703296-Pyramimonas_sp.AAC.1
MNDLYECGRREAWKARVTARKRVVCHGSFGPRSVGGREAFERAFQQMAGGSSCELWRLAFRLGPRMGPRS